MTSMTANELVSTIVGLALALGSVPVILPLTALGGLRRKLGHVTVMAVVAVLSIVTYALAAWDATRSLWSLPLPLLALAGAYGLSEATSRASRSLAGEAIKPPAAVARQIKRSSMGSWFIRIVIALGMIVDIAVVYSTGAASITLQLLFAAALAACAVAGLAGKREYPELSEFQHQEEIARFLSWVHEKSATTIIHVPDGKSTTLSQLAALLKELSDRKIEAAIVCRGKKTFSAVSAKWPTKSWLVRTSHDLDDYAVAPIARCLHMPVGTTAGHMVSLRKLKQVIVIDVVCSAVIGQSVPKEMRMYDEIWMRGEPPAQLIADAAEYGITVSSMDPVMPFLNRVPSGDRITCALIIPKAQGTGDDLTYFETAVPALNVVAAHAGTGGARFVVSFMDGDMSQGARVITRTLEALFDRASIVRANGLIDALNCAPIIVEGPWMQTQAAQAACRHIIALDAPSLPKGVAA